MRGECRVKGGGDRHRYGSRRPPIGTSLSESSSIISIFLIEKLTQRSVHLRQTPRPTLATVPHSGSKRLDLHGVTEISQALDQAALLLVLGATIEVTGAEVPIHGPECASPGYIRASRSSSVRSQIPTPLRKLLRPSKGVLQRTLATSKPSSIASKSGAAPRRRSSPSPPPPCEFDCAF